MFEGVDFRMVPLALLYLLCAVVGVVGNSIMILVFLKEKNFKQPCNYLITLSCLADLLHVSGHFVFNFQIFSNSTSSQAQCFYMLMPTIIGYCSSGPLLLSIGIDRLMSCTFPIKYRSFLRNKITYILLLLFFPILYTFVMLYFAFIMRDEKTQITCVAPAAMYRDSFLYYTYSTNLINFTIILIYFRVYWVLRSFTASGATKMRIIFKSIAINVIIMLVGWFTVTIGNIFAVGMIKNQELSRIVSAHVGIGVNLSCASNIFVFYSINSDYKIAIRQFFGLKINVQPLPSSKSTFSVDEKVRSRGIKVKVPV